MRKFVMALLSLAFCPAFLAQQVLNNDAVVKMVKAGLSDDIIIASINAQQGSYNTSTDGLVAFKAAGVSDKVVAAVIARAAAPLAPAPSLAAPPSAAPVDPDDPSTPHDPGVYLLSVNREGKQKMTFIDRAGAGDEKTSGILAHAFTYGIVKAKMKADLPGPHAVVRSEDARPVFYMYFPPSTNAGGLGGTDIVTSPEQFELLTLEEKKDHRETSIARVGFASVSAGNEEKKEHPFKSERVRPYVYKLTSPDDLKAGEYAFIATTRVGGTATGATVIIYDFGVGLN